MRSLLSLLLLGMILLPVKGQVTNEPGQALNQTDALGRKQGPWKKYHPNGNIQYEGTFVDDRPTGLFTRYHENGGISALMEYRSHSHRIYARIYYENGTLAGEGVYEGERKDSLWKYYSFYGGYITMEEPYTNGLKEGTAKKFFPSGSLSEITTWVGGRKHGPWERYYEDGTPMLVSSFEYDRIDGPYLMYYPDGTLQLKGTYLLNQREGRWEYFNEQGRSVSVIRFENGTPLNAAELNRKELEFLDSLENNKGKIAEPTIDDLMRPTPPAPKKEKK